MKRLFFISMLFLLGVACSQDDSLTATVDPVPEGGRNANPYTVTVEEALANLDQVLAQIDGETRAGGMRRAVSVDRVKAADVCDLTRSEAALDVEDLLYVVSFGEGNGSAVLGADKRVTQVMAVLDETVLTAEDFVRNSTRSSNIELDDSDLQTYLTNSMIDLAREDVLTTTDFEIIEPVPMKPGPKFTTEICDELLQTPLTATKWGQSAPFNNQCPYKTNSTTQRKPAGCGPIAIAQLLAFYQYPENNNVSSFNCPWSLLNQCNYPTDPEDFPSQAATYLALYIRGLGIQMGTNYGDTGSNTSSANMIAFLNSIGVSAISLEWTEGSGVTSIVVNRISVEKEPVPIIGFYGTQSNECHIWLLDGMHQYTKYVYMQLYGEFGYLPKELVTQSSVRFFHCNYGWEGLCDGYYTHQLYDTTDELQDEYIDTSVGDYKGVGGYNFNKRMVIYNITNM